MDRKPGVEQGAPTDNIEWLERSQYWQSYRPVLRGGPKKFLFREPLILVGHGIRINIDHGSLLIRCGFTHYPQIREEIRIFPGDSNMPDRIVILDADGSISLAALTWMAEQKIILVQLNWRGDISFVGNSYGYSADRKLVAGQLALRETNKSNEYSRNLLEQKIQNSISTLKNVFPENENRNLAIDRLGQWHKKAQKLGKSFSASALLGIEGIAAASYFRGWHGTPLKWTGLNKRPIPKHWLEIGPRAMGWRKHGDNARHPINSMLNYGYAMLVSQLRAEVLAAGFDPSLAFVHGSSRHQMPLVYDLMEPLRPAVDERILRFALSTTFSPGDFTINRVGGCRLNPQLAKKIAAIASKFETAETIRSLVLATTGGNRGRSRKRRGFGQ